MTRYRYTAMAAAGAGGAGSAPAGARGGGGGGAMAGTRGEREAVDEGALRAELKREGLIVVEVKPVGVSDALRATLGGLSGLTGAAGAGGRGRGPGSGPAVPTRDAAWFFQTLALLLKNQVPVESALSTMDELAPTDRLRGACAAVRDALRSGNSAADAVKRVPGLATRQHVALLRSAQESGRLDHAVALIDRSITASARVRSTVVKALAYPAGLGVLTLLVLWFLATFVIPRFAETLESLGGTLPWQTSFTLSAARVLVYLVPALAVAAIVAWRLRGVWLTTARRRALHEMVLRMPVAGGLLWNGQGALVCETMATMLEGGSDALTALGQAEAVATSPVICDRLGRARRLAREGVDLGQAFKDHQVLPPMAQAVLRVAMRAGDLSAGVRQAADLCEQRHQILTQRLLGILGPSVIVIMALCVAWVVYSLVSGMMALNEWGGAL
ncbi:MAG: type II secretion system F family protein [Phycisphaerales bacterium]